MSVSQILGPLYILYYNPRKEQKYKSTLEPEQVLGRKMIYKSSKQVLFMSVFTITK